MSVHGPVEIATNIAKTESAVQRKVLANGSQTIASSKYGNLWKIQTPGLLFSS
jgi:hypothetical protein